MIIEQSIFIDKEKRSKYFEVNKKIILIEIFNFCLEGSYLIHQLQNQISSLFIKFKPYEQSMDIFRCTQNRNMFIFIRICLLFKNLRYLNFSSSCVYEQLSFSDGIPTDLFSNLFELHVVVNNIMDCLCILDGQFERLHTFHVTIRSRGVPDDVFVGNHVSYSD